MPILPKANYSLPPEKQSRLFNLVAQTLVVIIFAPLILGSPFLWSEFTSIKDDLWLSYRGVLARNPDAYFIQHQTRYRQASFCVSYETQQSQRHEKCTDLLFPFFEPNTRRPLVVHYDPASPDHASTNWGLRLIPGRVLMFLLLIVFCLAIDAMAVFVVWKKFKSPDLRISTAERDLSAVLGNLVSNLRTQPHNSDYAKSLATGLDPLVQLYKQAIPETFTTGEASRTLGEIILFTDNYRAEKEKLHIHFGSNYTDNLRKYDALVEKLRQANYGSESQ